MVTTVNLVMLHEKILIMEQKIREQDAAIKDLQSKLEEKEVEDYVCDGATQFRFKTPNPNPYLD